MTQVTVLQIEFFYYYYSNYHNQHARRDFVAYAVYDSIEFAVTYVINIYVTSTDIISVLSSRLLSLPL